MLKLFGSSKPETQTREPMPGGGVQRSGSNSPARNNSGGSELSAAFGKTMGNIGKAAMPPLVWGLIVVLTVFLIGWVLSQTIVLLYNVHRPFLVLCLSALIGAILVGTARLAFGQAGVAVGIGQALKQLLVAAEQNNWNSDMVKSRLMLIGMVTGLYIFVTLFAIAILGGAAMYITAQRTSDNIFSFNSDAMLNTAGTQFNQNDFDDRYISIMPTTGAGKAIGSINSAGIKSPSPAAASAGSAASGNSIRYTVLKGDTFGKIATKYGITVADLKAANKAIAGQKFLKTGQTLVIPQ